MGSKSKFRGHDIECLADTWYFCDTGKPVEETYIDRPCGHCCKVDTKEGHDGCLGTLPGLMNACCGHGIENEAYIQFLDGYIVNGLSAKNIITELKKIEALEGECWFFHRWELVRDNGFTKYFKCKKCPARKADQPEGGGYQPIDIDWINDKKEKI